jgi:para-nitrobenzyl esterase
MAPVVHTSSGRLRSVPEEGVLVFRGIPYAQPPIGPLRFRPPHKLATWDGIREASTYGPTAMQGGNPVNSARLPQVQRAELPGGHAAPRMAMEQFVQVLTAFLAGRP